MIAVSKWLIARERVGMEDAFSGLERGNLVMWYGENERYGWEVSL
ncbi:MAG: hypothetical protein ACOYBE_01165 [Blautia sp.]|jgi:hypothetical protein